MILSILASLVFYLLTYGRLNTIFLLLAMGVIVGFSLFKHHNHNHGDLLMAEKLSQKSPMRGTNPLWKLSICLFLIILTVAGKSNVLSAFVFIVSTIIILHLNNISLDTYLNLIGVPLGFMLLSTLGIVVQYSTSKLGFLDLRFLGGFLSITQKGQTQGISLLGISLASVNILILLGISTPMADIISTLQKIKLPKILIEIMYLIYRYVFILLFILNQLQISANSRLGFSKNKRGYSTTFMLASRLMNKSIRSAIISFNAMESRLYDGDLQFLVDNNYDNKYLVYLFGFGIIALVILGLEVFIL